MDRRLLLCRIASACGLTAIAPTFVFASTATGQSPVASPADDPRMNFRDWPPPFGEMTTFRYEQLFYQHHVRRGVYVRGEDVTHRFRYVCDVPGQQLAILNRVNTEGHMYLDEHGVLAWEIVEGDAVVIRAETPAHPHDAWNLIGRYPGVYDAHFDRYLGGVSHQCSFRCVACHAGG